MRRTLALSFMWIALAPLSVLGASSYTIIPLPTPPGTTNASVRAISPGGLTAGEAFIGDYNSLTGYYQPLVWQNGSYTLLPLPQGMSGAVTGINDTGQVIGGIWPGPIPGQGTPGTWQNGQFQSFPTPPGTSVFASGIDREGNVIGSVESDTDRLANGIVHAEYAVLWSNGQAMKIGDFPGAATSPTAINNRGDILLNVGDGTYADAYIWSPSGMTQIQPISGNVVAGYGMNDADQVVGSGLGADDTWHAFLWQNGTTLDLGNPVGGSSTTAVAINNFGAIVGYGYDPTDKVHGLLWENGQLFELSALIPSDSGWGGLWPTGIADDGTIAGTGIYNGQYQAFLLAPANSSAPTPEPATAATLLLPATLLLCRTRRKT